MKSEREYVSKIIEDVLRKHEATRLRELKIGDRFEQIELPDADETSIKEVMSSAHEVIANDARRRALLYNMKNATKGKIPSTRADNRPMKVSRINEKRIALGKAYAKYNSIW